MAGSALPPARLGCLSPSLHCSEFEHLVSGNRPISAHLAPSCKQSARSGRFLQDKPGSCRPKLIPLTCGCGRNRQEVTGSLQVAGLEPPSLGSAQGPPPRTLASAAWDLLSHLGGWSRRPGPAGALVSPTCPSVWRPRSSCRLWEWCPVSPWHGAFTTPSLVALRPGPRPRAGGGRGRKLGAEGRGGRGAPAAR